MAEHVVDPLDREGIRAWLEREGFKDFEGHGYWERCYSLSHSRPVLRVGIPDGQICATLDISGDNGKRVYLGQAYTVAPIAALWAVLNLFDFEEGRDAMFWRDYHERRYPLTHAEN